MFPYKIHQFAKTSFVYLCFAGMNQEIQKAMAVNESSVIGVTSYIPMYIRYMKERKSTPFKGSVNLKPTEIP